jgi:hypothetical protein
MMIPLIAGPPTMGACDVEGCPAGWITPGDTRAEQDNVNEAVQQLDSDIRAAGSVSLIQAWTLYKNDWDAFYSGQGGFFGWLDRFATATAYAKTLDYRKQLESWRGRYVQEGGTTSGPGLVSKPATQPDAIATYLRWGAIIAAVGGGIYLLSILRGPLTSLVAARANPGRPRRRRRRR